MPSPLHMWHKEAQIPFWSFPWNEEQRGETERHRTWVRTTTLKKRFRSNGRITVLLLKKKKPCLPPSLRKSCWASFPPGSPFDIFGLFWSRRLADFTRKRNLRFVMRVILFSFFGVSLKDCCLFPKNMYTVPFEIEIRFNYWGEHARLGLSNDFLIMDRVQEEQKSRVFFW